MKKLFLTGVAVLFLATGAAHATERYLVRCAGQVFTVYGHHGYMFFRGEPANMMNKKSCRIDGFAFAATIYYFADTSANI